MVGCGLVCWTVAFVVRCDCAWVVVSLEVVWSAIANNDEVKMASTRARAIGDVISSVRVPVIYHQLCYFCSCCREKSQTSNCW